MEQGSAPKRNKGLSGQAIRLIAIVAMLCDHVGRTIAQNHIGLTYIGRIAFPLFAFLLVEGFYHTSSRSKYLLRLLVFAALSEIPFNLMHSGHIVDTGYQNVLWTLALGLAAVIAIHFVKTKLNNVVITGVFTAATALFTMHIADELLVDYYGFGVLTILLFYTVRDLRYAKTGQLAGLFLINVVWMSGITTGWTLFGHIIGFPLQGLALLALPLIWKYNGNRGPDHLFLHYASYAFYPVHLLILAMLAMNGVTLN
ncbi:MAG: TraX family protein [Bacillota bacterium]|jgi:hypothetical protein|nr:TraX family protein [Eubacteriales bacterium]MDI9492748.1 TraX family protein [Bacillota bacterium]NLV69504.1 conjugal transfer protein TraX [Clostridiales bacterium]MDD3536713.1 TraX family protein [Eubacteriales bacterium]MDD4285932.1 TraX family protein [Eubacteriales bacterium]